jgi:hypothetical protein
MITREWIVELTIAKNAPVVSVYIRVATTVKRPNIVHQAVTDALTANAQKSVIPITVKAA